MNRLILAPTSLPQTPPMAYIRAASTGGFDGVGLRLFEAPHARYPTPVGDRTLLGDMKRLLDDTGLEVVDILSFYLQPGVDQDRFEAAFAAGAELGGKYVLVIGNDPDWGRMRDDFGRLCDTAAQYGLTASIEFVVMRTLHSLPLALRMIAEAGRANAVLCVDPVNFVRGGGTPADIRAADASLFPYAQLGDGILNPGEPDPALLGRMKNNERTLYGAGMIDLHGILDALPAGLPLSIEMPVKLSAAFPDRNGIEMSAAEWTGFLGAHTREYLAAYHAARAAR